MDKKPVIGLAVNPATTDSEEPINEEYASPRTIQGITTSLEAGGARVIQIDADEGVYEKLSGLQEEVDIVFNITEGLPQVRSRKSTVAGILDHLGIPYTGSGVRALILGNDKSLARQVLAGKVKNPQWQRFKSVDDPLDGLEYPLFVKPATEGCSVGVEQSSVVSSEAELRRALHTIINGYGSALVEDFLQGPEYEIGLVGTVVLPPIGWYLEKIPGNPRVRDPSVKDIENDYCVTVDSDGLHYELARQAIQSHTGIGARDYSRSDFRMQRRDSSVPIFLEINLMPGLDPEKSDLPREASLAGIEYQDLVNSIVYVAMKRYQNVFSSRRIEGFHAAYNTLLRVSESGRTIDVEGSTYRIAGVAR